MGTKNFSLFSLLPRRSSEACLLEKPVNCVVKEKIIVGLFLLSYHLELFHIE